MFTPKIHNILKCYMCTYSILDWVEKGKLFTRICNVPEIVYMFWTHKDPLIFNYIQ